MFKTKTFITLAIAVCALAATSMPASAFFKATNGNYPVQGKALGKGIQKFSTPGATVECSSAVFKGTLVGEGSQLTVHPVYELCSNSIGGTTTVRTEGCNYNFHQALHAQSGTVSTECEAGKSFEIEIKFLVTCIMKIPGEQQKQTNKNLSEVKYTTLTQAPKRVEVEANVSPITYTASGCEPAIANGTHSDARYEGKAIADSNNGTEGVEVV